MDRDQTEMLVVSLQGSMADESQVPAFTSLESAHGLSQALMMIIHFAQSGEIRRRNFKDLDVDVRLSGTREGSFEFLFEYSQYAPFLIQAYGEALGNGSWQLIKTVFNRAIGLRGENEIEDAERDGRINAGDLGALIQAVEPSIRKAHSVVNHGASNVNIFINGDKNAISLDATSKEYMYESVFNDETRSQRFFVTSYDGRNRTGRLFDLEAEQAFTFDLLPEANRESLEVIVAAASAYALRQKGQFDRSMEVVCAFTSVDAPDGRQKRLKVFSAAPDFDRLEVNEYRSIAQDTTRITGESEDDNLIE